MTLADVIPLILLLAAAAAMVPIIAFCTECLAALLPKRKWNLTETRRPRTVVLIPAHNEESVLGETLETLFPTLAPGDRVLVVADNCTDRTASLARHLGAEVLERADAERRGKGYALDFGIRHLEAAPPDVVVVLDADCLVESQTVEWLSRLAALTERPVQARNLTDRNSTGGAIQAVSVFGNRITNLVRPLGLARLGAPCRLMGTGMAIPWPLLKKVQLADGNLVEDLQLGIDLLLAGYPAVFCPEAGVTSALPQAHRAFVSQRTRWDHGHLRAARTQIPRLLCAAWRRRNWRLLAMAADLGIPPLTLLAVFWLTMTVLCAAAWFFGVSGAPLAVLAVGGIALSAVLAVSWAVFCRRHVPLRGLVGIPFYMARKAPIYARFFFERQHLWVRTEREPAAHGEAAVVSYTLHDDPEHRDCRLSSKHNARDAESSRVLGARRPHP